MMRCRSISFGDGNENRAPTRISRQRQEDFGHRTYNHYGQAIDGFGNWLVSTKRASVNPFAGLTRLNAEVDIRHPRRALSVQELGQLIASARKSGKDIQCFSPEERARIYIIAGLTGLRRKEIASLTPHSFDLKAKALANLPSQECKWEYTGYDGGTFTGTGWHFDARE